MNRLHGICRRKTTLKRIISALKDVGFEKLIILSNTGSHTYSQCRIKDIGETVEIETHRGKILISFKDIRYARLSYRNAVCLFETSPKGREEYRAENWFLMDEDQYKKFCMKLKDHIFLSLLL